MCRTRSTASWAPPVRDAPQCDARSNCRWTWTLCHNSRISRAHSCANVSRVQLVCLSLNTYERNEFESFLNQKLISIVGHLLLIAHVAHELLVLFGAMTFECVSRQENGLCVSIRAFVADERLLIFGHMRFHVFFQRESTAEVCLADLAPANKKSFN